MFGQMGYANGVGIVLGSISLGGNLLQFLSIFLVKDPPGLDLEMKVECKLRSDSDAKNIVATIASWCGFVASCFVASVGITRIIKSDAKLRFCDGPNDDFADDDCNAGFRYNLFTFAPDAFGKSA